MKDITLLILQSIYLLVPAYFANMAPPIAKRLGILKILNKPVDNNKKFRNKPIFGKNKTYRGFVTGIFAAIIGIVIQKFLFNANSDIFRTLSIGIDYNNITTILILGILMGFGALMGDLIESFFKRQMDIKPGFRFIPWDQIDHTIGAYIFIFPVAYTFLSWQLFISSLIVGFLLHIIVNHISYYIGVRKEKW